MGLKEIIVGTLSVFGVQATEPDSICQTTTGDNQPAIVARGRAVTPVTSDCIKDGGIKTDRNLSDEFQYNSKKGEHTAPGVFQETHGKNSPIINGDTVTDENGTRKITPDADGAIRYNNGGQTIVITPR